MNMVTKSGGNRFTSDHNFYFMNDSAAGRQRRRRPARAARPAPRARRPAPPATRSTSPTTGARRSAARSSATRLWFFGAIAPVAARPVPDRRAQPRRLAGHRRQPHRELHGQGHRGRPRASTRASFMFNRNLKNRFHRRDAPVPVRRGQGDDAPGPAGAELRRAVQPGASGSAACSTRASAACGATSRAATRTRSPTDIAVRDIVRNSRASTPPRSQSINPNHRYQANAHLQLLRAQTCSAARTTSRPACSCRGSGWATTASATATSCSSCATASPFQAQIANTPIVSDHQMETLGRVPAGPLGARAARPSTSACASTASSGYLPGRRARPAPTSASARSRDRHLRLLAERRAAPRHLLRRVRQRPDRAQGLLRPLLQPVRLGDRRGHQPERAGHAERGVDRHATTTVPLDAGELGAFAGVPARPVPDLRPGRATGPTATR